MSQINSCATEISQIFIKYCKGKNYQVNDTKNADDDWRLDIATLNEKTIVTIYHTGSVVQGGPNNSLKKEFTKLISEFNNNSQSFLGAEKLVIKSCAQKYNILLSKLRIEIKESLSNVEKAKINIIESPSAARNDFSLTATQYNNGTLLLQGKTDKLFDEICDLIDKTANPSDKEVISRFISCDEEYLKAFAAKYTPEIITMAENNVKRKVGDVFTYLELYDKKWFVASECLCLAAIPLPEFSPLVMPASKAFEGFAKKLIVGIGLVDADHFKTKKGNFSELNDTKNPRRMAICAKEKYVDTWLKKLSVCLDMNRNFMMHSDDSQITKVDSQKEAEGKVNGILRETKEIFDYFNNFFRLLPP
jgi:hypothetical protein